MLWQLKERAPDEFKSQFPELNPVLADLLWQRGLREQTLIDEFFNPDFETDLHDPYLMPNMDLIIGRILEAIAGKEQIAIFGDYDVDGVSGTVMLLEVLKKCGLDPYVYLPDRAKEGYGLNKKAILEFKEKGAKLLISVDCGMSDVEEADYCAELGIDLLIVDHHQPLEKLPQCIAILNPHLHQSNYPFKDLSAAGVVFKLITALVSKLRENSELKEFFPVGFEKWQLDLVALATVADSMPLKGENRTLLHYGLLVLAQTKRVGLQELMAVSGVKPILQMQAPCAAESEIATTIERRTKTRKETNLNPQTIAFSLAPRLNAASRMDHANLSLDLLITENPLAAKELAEKLDVKNRSRFTTVKRIIDQAFSKIELEQEPVLLIGDPDWPIGVLGIVAGKIVEDLERPVFIYQDLGPDSVGSARSVNGFNLVEAMESCKEILKEYGGHKSAAGFRFDSKNSSGLRQALIRAFEAQKSSLKSEEPVLEIDLELKPEDFSNSLYENLRKMEPFGLGNPVPRFLMKGLKITDRSQVGRDSQHCKLKLSAELPGRLKKFFSALAFNQILPDHLKFGEFVDVVCEMMPDEYNGSLNLSLKILDIRQSEVSAS